MIPKGDKESEEEEKLLEKIRNYVQDEKGFKNGQEIDLAKHVSLDNWFNYDEMRLSRRWEKCNFLFQIFFQFFSFCQIFQFKKKI